LFILEHFPISTPIYAYDFLDTGAELQPSLFLALHSRHDSFASLVIWYSQQSAVLAAFEGMSLSQRRKIGGYYNATNCIRADDADGWVV